MNKKYILLAIVVAFLSACQPSKIIEFDVTATGLSSGVFTIKDQGQQTIFGENIKNGKCTVKKQLDEPGFYELNIAKDGIVAHTPFEVYLEPGKYTITADANKLSKYPKIESSSKKQQEITNYYAIYDEVVGNARAQTTELNKELEDGGKNLPENAYRNLVAKIEMAQDKARHAEFTVLERFVKKYPESELAAHFMAKQAYTDFPEKYQTLFNILNATAKNSEEGKEISKKLTLNINLAPGKKAPAIEGKFFDGKTFAAVKAGKKLFLIDFWRSVNQFSRINHEDIQAVYGLLKDRGFEVISVSLDKKQLWWATAVKDDKLPWPQISDLKGNDSPNAANWNVTTIPTYYLVDKDWNIYMKDISLGSVKLEATQYLEKHK
ncbi:MAG: thioredoxin-like domain-containing protein [Mucilaginibacter sp.]|uniref:TlpA family protein disulfide reductase n=1 Tax=Mucilaginibacter sp. TaxID=1882438 RepID=UPI0032634AD9